MSTARSSADRAVRDVGRAVADLGALVGFRLAGLRGATRTRAHLAVLVLLLVTLAAGVVPAYLPGAVTGQNAQDVLLLLPSAYLSLLGIAVLSAASSGGGRELLARDQAVAYPVSPTTDHLGALLMAPLNIAWLIQSWGLLGGTSYALGTRHLPATLLPVLLWLALATALAQAVAWVVEWVRRGRHGIVVVRAATLVLAGAAGWLVASDRVTGVLDRSPTLRVVLLAVDGRESAWAPWLLGVTAMGALLLLVVALGAIPAHLVAARQPREELRLESGVRSARPDTRSDLTAMLRVDRAAIWRSVPLRRGLMVLAVMPGLVAVAGALRWDMLTIMPGLVASGGALLFGVNAWCLDGRGALWRDSLPTSPDLPFLSRVVVLVEVLLVASLVTIALGSLRAGRPTASAVVALGCATLVVTVQVVAAVLRWSVHRPFAVDMRGARATPAPPLVMVGYSARLALTTTLTGLVFSGLARFPAWQGSVLVAVVFWCFSARSLLRTRRAWGEPETRCRVVTTVAA